MSNKITKEIMNDIAHIERWLAFVDGFMNYCFNYFIEKKGYTWMDAHFAVESMTDIYFKGDQKSLVRLWQWTLGSTIIDDLQDCIISMINREFDFEKEFYKEKKFLKSLMEYKC